MPCAAATMVPRDGPVAECRSQRYKLESSVTAAATTTAARISRPPSYLKPCASGTTRGFPSLTLCCGSGCNDKLLRMTSTFSSFFNLKSLVILEPKLFSENRSSLHLDTRILYYCIFEIEKYSCILYCIFEKFKNTVQQRPQVGV